MHESSLAGTVLAVVRAHASGGPPVRVRVHVYDASTPPDDLARRLSTYLSAATPPAPVAGLEVSVEPRERLCAGCALVFTSAEPDPACPDCGGPALPAAHDHRVEVELLPA